AADQLLADTSTALGGRPFLPPVESPGGGDLQKLLGRVTLLLQADDLIQQGHVFFLDRELAEAEDAYAQAEQKIRGAVALMTMPIVIQNPVTTPLLPTLAKGAAAFRASLDPNDLTAFPTFGDLPAPPRQAASDKDSGPGQPIDIAHDVVPDTLP